DPVETGRTHVRGDQPIADPVELVERAAEADGTRLLARLLVEVPSADERFVHRDVAPERVADEPRDGVRHAHLAHEDVVRRGYRPGVVVTDQRAGARIAVDRTVPAVERIRSTAEQRRLEARGGGELRRIAEALRREQGEPFVEAALRGVPGVGLAVLLRVAGP